MILYFLLYVLILVVSVCVCFELYKKFDRSWKLLHKIPGMPSYPVIGSLPSLLTTNAELRFKADRTRHKLYGPIFSLSLFNIKIVALLHPEDVEKVLSNINHITKSEIYRFLHDWLGTGLLTSTGSKWQHRRKILTPAFHFNILQDFIKVFNAETKNLVQVVKALSVNGAIDVVSPITQFTLLSINETAMGKKLNLGDNDTNGYKSAIYKLGNLLVKRVGSPWLHSDFVYSLTDQGREQKRLIKSLHSVSNHVITERAKTFDKADVLKKQQNVSYSTRKRLAMLDLLLCAMDEGAIDRDGIREEVDTFMFEGHDTTAMAICYALLEIANHKPIQEEICREIQEVLGASIAEPTYKEFSEMKYLERVIKEVLRLYPSVPYMSRVCGEEFVTKDGYTIPKDCLIDLFVIDMHRNPNVYPDPDKFDPDRFLPENCKNRHPFAYIPFSAGPRNCIGQKFAMLELKAVLVGILKQFVLEPATKRDEVVFISDLVLRPNRNGIKVKFVPRNARK